MSTIEIIEVAGERRTVYRQTDGSTILADECKCRFGETSFDCPVDDHAIRARMKELEAS